MPERAVSIRPEQLLEHVGWVRQLAAELIAGTDADDVAQQTLLTALERPPPHGDAPRAWLARVARSVVGRLRRSNERRARREAASPVPHGEAAAAEIVERANTQRTVVDAVLALDEPYRSTILLRYFEELDARAIAQRLDVPVETVRTRVKRGLAMLRVRLEERFGGEASWIAALVVVTGSRSTGTGATASTATAGTMIGALLMSTNAKLVVAAALIAGSAVATWHATRPAPSTTTVSESVSSTSPTEAIESPSATDTAGELKASREPVDGSSAPLQEESVRTLAPPVLRGTVRDDSGKPVGGATVVLEDADPLDFKATLYCRWSDLLLAQREHGSPLGGTGEAARLFATTDAEGRFSFSDVPHVGTWNLAAIHRRAGFAWNDHVVVDAAAGSQSVDLELEPGLVVSGTVTDPAGAPLVGARVVLDGVLRRKDSATSSQTLPALETDRDGNFVSDPTPFRDLWMHAEKRGWFRSETVTLQPLPEEHARRVDFRLERGRIVSGRLLNGAGNSAALRSLEIPDLSVRATRDEPAAGTRPHGQSASIDRDLATYEFAPIDREVRFISAWSRETLLGTSALPFDGDGPDFALGGIDPGPDVPIDIERLPKPRPKGTFSTVVIDAATTTPIERYQIQFVTRGSSWGRSSKDADGRWRSDPIDVGRYQVAVNATGYAPLTHPIEVTENQDAGPLAFALLRADSRLVGQVHDRDGQSLARSRVWLCTSDGEPALRIGDDSVEADSRGGFTFGGLAKGDYLVVAFENPKHDAPSRELAPASMRVSVRGETTLDLQLLPGVAVRLEPRGPGIESAAVSVRVRDARGAWVRDDLGGGGVCSQSGGGGISVLLAPGWYCAEVHADGFRVGRVEFVAAPDVVVPIELIRNDR